MRESNAPSPPVSQSAAITSSRRNNLLLRARQTLERAAHVVYPLLRGASSGGGCWPAATARLVPVPTARRRQRRGCRTSRPAGPATRPGRPGQTPALRRSVTPHQAARCAHRGSATQRHHEWTVAPGNQHVSPRHRRTRHHHTLEWVPVKNSLWSGRALRARLVVVTWLYRNSGVPVASCRRPGRRQPRC
jgi:hypothetical protein